MALPTQEDFLANALGPVEPMEHDDCAICTFPMTSPARLPCKNVFCKSCITKWLTQPGVDSCPMCRRRLFKPSLSAREEANLDQQTANEAEIAARTLLVADMDVELERMRIVSLDLDFSDDRAWTAEMNRRTEARALWARRRIANLRLVAVEDAFVAAGLVHALRRNARTDFRSADVLGLNFSVRWSEELLNELKHDARSILINNDVPRLQQGAVRIVAESVGTSLVLISNALMRLASRQSRPWSVANRRVWRQAVINIWQLVSPENGLLLDRQSLHIAIMSCVVELCHNGDEQGRRPPMLFRERDLVRDLRFMVHFVVDHAGATMESDVVREELAAHRIEEPRVLTRTVSVLATRLAAEYTNMAFVRV
jgi:hypothetical protein